MSPQSSDDDAPTPHERDDTFARIDAELQFLRAQLEEIAARRRHATETPSESAARGAAAGEPTE